MSKISINLPTLSLAVLLFVSSIIAQESNNQDGKKHYLESSVWMLMNVTSPSPDFYQLLYGYHITQEDVITLDLITWRYYYPLGIPWGPSFDAPSEKYPGYTRGMGIGIGYQKTIWKQAFVSISALSLLQKYYDQNDVVIQKGYQLFLMSKIGYQFNFFDDSFFIKPSIACNYWPIETNMPEEFKAKEDGWGNYFLLEPHLNFGFQF